MGNTYGNRIIVPLTNKSGGGVVAGDVVIIDTSNDSAFTTTTTSGFTGLLGVAVETIASNATGRICIQGAVDLVNVNASVTRGDYGKTHSVAKQATDAGASRAAGAFCQFNTGGTTPKATLFGFPDNTTGSGGVPSGASFPGSPSTNDLYYRTDRGIIYYYDGTRWLSIGLYTMNFSNRGADEPYTANSGAAVWVSTPAADYDLWLVTFYCSVNPQATNDGTHYWTIGLTKEGPTGNASVTTVNTSASTQGVWAQLKSNIGALLGATGYDHLYCPITKTSTPGNLYFVPSVTYRLVG